MFRFNRRLKSSTAFISKASIGTALVLGTTLSFSLSAEAQTGTPPVLPEGADADAAPSEIEASDPEISGAEQDSPEGEEQPPEPEPEPEPVAEEPEDPFGEETVAHDASFEPKVEPLPPPRMRPPSPFDQHSIRIGGSVGASSDWIILGIGAGYFVLDGLEAGLDTTFWLGGDPFISTLTPGVRYIFHFVPVVKPYVGGFYRHYFVAEHRFLADSDSIGARAGLLFMLGPSAFLGGGVIYEHFLDQDLYVEQDQFYPEIIIGFSF